MIDTTTSTEEQRRQLEITYGWLPAAAIDIYLEEWFRSGNVDTAWAYVQQDKRYELWFPGNLTEDGRPRLPEKDYAKTVAAYDEVFANVGINPEVMRARYGELISGDVSPYELETTRINPMHDRIVSQSMQLKSWYSEHFGIELTDAALIASAIDPSLGERILTRQIEMAEIGGEGREAGYEIDLSLVQRIVEETELTKAGAERSFLQAKSLIPVMNVLAGRHDDPDDDFDINEFIGADILRDPVQMRRMNRLVAQERATFGPSGTVISRSRTTGGLSGLQQS